MALSEDQKKKLAELFDLGWSDGLIAGEIGVSRNTVIGYRHRAGLLRAEGVTSIRRGARKPRTRQSPNASAPPSRPAHWLAPTEADHRADHPVALEGDNDAGVAYMDLRDGVHCRAFLGGRKDRDGLPLSCGRQIVSGSYCGRHAAIYFQQPERKR